jgi:hypothetical protein
MIHGRNALAAAAIVPPKEKAISHSVAPCARASLKSGGHRQLISSCARIERDFCGRCLVRTSLILMIMMFVATHR